VATSSLAVPGRAQAHQGGQLGIVQVPDPRLALANDGLGQGALGLEQSPGSLEKDIRDWIVTWNADPKPFVWTKTAEDILNSPAKYLKRTLDAGH
jgi:hypothetical protein